MPKKSATTGSTIGKRIVLSLLFFALFTALSLWFINRGVTPALVEIAETKAQQLARDAINEAVSKTIAEDLQFNDLVKMEKDDQGNIVYMGWNSVVVNRALRDTTIRVQNFLKRMELGELPMEDTSLEPDIDPDMSQEELGEQPATLIELPIGVATNNSLLANLGPTVPVQLRVIGDVQSEVEIEMSEYGINAALFELTIHFEVNVRIVIPFSTETTVVTNNIPIDQATILGEVPRFYGGMGGEGENPSFSVPMEPLQ
ncbi:sporulation protein YunB [Halobacillus karajensis]|uniref:Sporulation protein YunB n=1 Tax=Halobacillus karajensis TaxID=195088 RepID=A0A024P9X3_9BACI|nr:sporulation protein YunB [Halobacillus karajensis]CDQ21282.1 Sporulation protein YunB [Halobacillus karajensis]CDQ25648.1 Sporulation protein YunB [Halobacillus karajensis]CDQ25919.1 Sporulation protein YunB [Halobacillus karajensis]SEI10339.1 sporulation protein YunB [Halobacillus karajensis]